MPQNPSTSEPEDWMRRLQSGDERAFQFLWERFFRRMVTVARNRIPVAHRRDRDEEDVAISAFKSFCLGFQAGKFHTSESIETLWPLLVTITINKANSHLRNNLRQKRGGGQTLAGLDPQDLAALASDESNHEFQVAADEVVDTLIEAVQQTGDRDLVVIILASLQGDSTSEIASQLECSVRTVQRKLKTIQRLWESMVE